MIDYEALIDSYRRSLTSVLRGFRAGEFNEPFLETWVPDEDDAKSIAGLFEAASSSNVAELTLKIGPSTLGRIDGDRIAAIAGRFGAPTTTRVDQSLVVGVAFDRKAVATTAATAASRDSANAFRLARAKLHAKQRERAALRAILPAEETRAALYDRALQSVDAITREGHAAMADTTHLVVEENGATLEACVDARHVIVLARHRQDADASSLSPLLDRLCAVVESLPLREAAEHGASRLELELRGRGGARAVPGIVSPENADPRLALCARLLRSLLAKYADRGAALEGKNEFIAPSRVEWAHATPAEREARARDALCDVARGLGLGSEGIELSAIQGDGRVVVALSSDVPRERQSLLLFEIERALKASLDENVTVYLEEMADKNKLRRLNVKPASHVLPILSGPTK